MSLLDKSKYVFQRDEKGELLSQEVILDALDDNPSIMVTPLTRGELRKFQSLISEGKSEGELESDMIISHCKDPSFSVEEVDALRADVSSAIVTAIIAVSLNQKPSELKANGMKNAEDIIKKK